ncbi:hypothetical protein CEN45_12085 [Fischerella thermalis CCMEE 5198]|jgi:hypothetical protein|nr:hypothetical protein CEN45_12085 [Fischerella thermalis CCMEE 5198]PMB51523.1 hypothetical protein CEN39_14830 [Fischerella thermalis CCMEE 5201]
MNFQKTLNFLLHRIHQFSEKPNPLVGGVIDTLLPVVYSLPEGLGENLLDSKAIVDLLWMIVSF